MSDPITTVEVRVRHVIHEDGRMACQIVFPEAFSAIEVLGLLEAAKQEVFEAMAGRHKGRRCDDES